MKALKEQEIESIIDFVTLTSEDISELTYEKDGKEVKLSLKDRKMVMTALWWQDNLAQTRSGHIVSAYDWLRLTAEEFDGF